MKLFLIILAITFPTFGVSADDFSSKEDIARDNAKAPAECSWRSDLIRSAILYAQQGAPRSLAISQVRESITDKRFYKDRAISWAIKTIDSVYDDPLIHTVSADANANSYWRYCGNNYEKFGRKNALLK
ncbi:hypothetical protein [Yersinia alsatica]|uniref:hypothetical protein n=1 Tax=Yersinia alsatica TaxID=2890317 RepID=UPI0011A1D0DB|nr:hypothetical protein [Yersinia alsatica]